MSQAGLAATLFGPEDLRLVDAEPGPLAAGMVRVRFAAGGICGSDMHYFRHARTGDFVVNSPLILGHEIAGTVAEIGEGVAGFTVGDPVAVNPSRFCGQCDYCRQGRKNLCENIYFMGSASKTPHMQGGFASAFDVVPAQLVKVPPDVSLEAVALSEPLAVCLHAVARAGDLKGRRTIIFGAGPIGLLTLVSARLAGADHVAMADIAAAPLAFAERLGADATHDLSTSPGPDLERRFDVAIEASGAAAGLSSAIRAARRGGIVVQLGNLPGGSIEVPANAVMAKELDLRGTFRFGDEFEKAVDLIVRGAVDVMSIVTARRPLSDAPEAFRLALDRSQSVKVLLTA